MILDGQQRLTTLYLLTRGEIPPYYTENDLKTDPRTLYFDLDSGDFQYFQAMRMRSNPTWIAVTECFTNLSINAFELAKQKSTEGQDPFELAQRYNDNLNRLRNTLEKEYPVQSVPSSAQIDEAIDVFDRVNSLGTKLTDAELALAHITGKWPQARQVMKDKIAELESKRFAFDLMFMVRSFTGVVNGRALFETIHQTSLPELKNGWEKLTKILDYLVMILPGHASIHSTPQTTLTPRTFWCPSLFTSPNKEASLKKSERCAYAFIGFMRQAPGPGTAARQIRNLTMIFQSFKALWTLGRIWLTRLSNKEAGLKLSPAIWKDVLSSTPCIE